MGWGPALGGVGATLDTARAAAARRDWVAARDAFAAVSEQLTADDLYAYGNCHWWMGDLATALPILQDAHRAYLAEGAPRRAALVAIDIGYSFALRGEEAQATGWMGRAVRLLDAEPDCAEKGYLVYIGFEDAWGANDLDTAMERGHQVHAIGSRFGEPNLCALGVLAQGRVLVKLGRVREGMALLDEAMVAAVSDDLDPGWAGNIYCHLMLACYELADWRRAQEWTDVTARWCQQMPGAGPFLGICRVHRAQVLQARGEWSTAEDEVVRVCAELDGFHHGMVAEAQYHLGDLRRQRGDLAGAEAAFAEADRLGRDPQPGRALLRLAQGDRSAARSEIEPACTAAGTDPLAGRGCCRPGRRSRSPAVTSTPLGRRRPSWKTSPPATAPPGSPLGLLWRSGSWRSPRPAPPMASPPSARPSPRASVPRCRTRRRWRGASWRTPTTPSGTPTLHVANATWPPPSSHGWALRPARRPPVPTG